MESNDVIKSMELNKQQKEIVEAEDKHMLVIACPGSGKTHTLISRVIHLVLNKKVEAEKMILITFTNKAGREMEERLKDKMKDKNPYYVGSLHGLGYRLLQEFNGINYTVLDVADSKQILLEEFEEHFTKNDVSEDELSYISKVIPEIINKASTSYPPKIDEVIDEYNLNIYNKRIKEIISYYEKRKMEENLIDFNDLMVKLYQLLLDSKTKKFLKEIKYVFFDEYQDINPIQQQILKIFAKKSNIMVVGDDAQAIYSFRGSSVEYIWDFQKSFPKSKKYMLETNYRSSPRVIDFCQNIIKQNTRQFQKNMISGKTKKGSLPCISGFADKNLQYKWIVEDIKRRKKKGMDYRDMVILSRTNKLLDYLELFLFKSKIPFQKNLGKALLEKNHIKDFLAFVTIIINPRSTFHWKRIVGLHSKVGLARAQKMIRGSSDIYKEIKKQVNKSSYIGKHLVELLETLKEIKKHNSDQVKISFIKGYLSKVYQSMNCKDLKERMIDIDLVLSFLKSNNLSNFIAELYLNAEATAKDEDGILLTTVHRSKGLEWKNVYIIDMTCKNFPFIIPKNFNKQMEEMEEERRLFYVAASRSKKYLNCTFCYDYSYRNPILPSPFLREIEANKYLKSDVDWKKVVQTGQVSKDVNNYLRYIGYAEITPLMNKLDFKREIIHQGKEIPIYMKKLNMNLVIGTFFDYLITKMVQINYPNKIKKFDLKINKTSNKFPTDIHHKYIDPLHDWRDLISEIADLSTLNCRSEIKKQYLADWVTKKNMLEFFEVLEAGIKVLIDKEEDVENLETHYSLTFGKLKAESDIILNDNIIEIKSSNYQICTIGNVLQGIIYTHLMRKKLKKVNNLIMYNPLTGEKTTFYLEDFKTEKILTKIYPEEKYLEKIK